MFLYTTIFSIPILITFVNPGTPFNTSEIVNIISNNFPSGLIYVHPSKNCTEINLSQVLYQLNRELKYTFYIVGTNLPETEYLPKGYLITAYDFNDFNQSVSSLVVLNPKACFIVWVQTSGNFESYFRVLRDMKVYDVNLFYQQQHITMVRSGCDVFSLQTKEVFGTVKFQKNKLNLHKCVINILTRTWEPYILEEDFFDPITMRIGFTGEIYP